MAVAAGPISNTDSQERTHHQAGADIQVCQRALGEMALTCRGPQMAKVPCHFPAVSKVVCRAESTSVLRLYQRGGIQLCSVSTGNGTEGLPLEQWEGNQGIKRNDQLQCCLMTRHSKHVPINQSIYKYLFGAYSHKSCMMCQRLSWMIFRYYQASHSHYRMGIINPTVQMRTETTEKLGLSPDPKARKWRKKDLTLSPIPLFFFFIFLNFNSGLK